MKNFGTKIKRIFNLNIHNLFKTAVEISIKIGKSRIFIVLDMIYCAIRYGTGYKDYKDCELYFADKEAKSTYLTETINNEIIDKYNDKDLFPIFENRTEFYKTYSNFVGRRWVDLNEVDNSKFSIFIKKYNTAIVKAPDKNSEFESEIRSFDNVDNLYNAYSEMVDSGQTIIEEIIEQHPTLKKINPEFFNHVKVYTFVKDEKAYILQIILVSEINGNRVYSFANSDGKIFTPACDENGKAYDRNPDTNVSFVGMKIPMHIHLKEFAKNVALQIHDAAYVCWDIAITPKGFALLDGNIKPPVLQPRASFNKGGNGILPIYRRYINI